MSLAGGGVLGGAEDAEPEAGGPPDGPGPSGGSWFKSSFLISFTTAFDAAMTLSNASKIGVVP